jgi:hypothetical protein
MIWALMIPLMVLGIAIATVPIIFAISQQERERRVLTFSADVRRDLSALDQPPAVTLSSTVHEEGYRTAS